MDNRFGLLFESDDVSDIKEAVQKKKVQVQPKAKPAAAAPNNAATKKVAAAEKPQKPQHDDKKGFKEEKENRGAGKKVGGGAGDKKFTPNGDKIDRKPRENQRYQRDRNNQQPRDGKRQFDRQSGSDKTGVKAVEKRNGAGAHNWGSVKQDIDMNLETMAKDPQNTTTDEEQKESAGQKEESIVEPKVLTLDEWKAQQELKRGAKPQYNIRKAGEGEDLSPQWEKMVALKKASKKTDEEEFEYDPSLYPQRVGRLQRIVDIQFNFNDGRRGGGGAPGGGRFRNKKPERTGGDNNNVKFTRAKREVKREQHAPKVDDVRQFPTLS
uniref:Hyaluronan/mRNA-binding protein domain-containing protein n=1 Tax=Megaselia scalaris TaxID=36166 RepID=T1H4L6_MEGSC